MLYEVITAHCKKQLFLLPSHQALLSEIGYGRWVTWFTPTKIQHEEFTCSSIWPCSVHAHILDYYFAYLLIDVIISEFEHNTALCFPWNYAHLESLCHSPPSMCSARLAALHMSTHSPLVTTRRNSNATWAIKDATNSLALQ